ncbi:unnamed protein product [Plutella xylostella]|uniref:(diamondback moth) hypothetical protein n=1 Tax=Plutella xylostella TaxID=51655 RepID=A0A8S4FXY2_PLUXY|nr:unnamed protein product [Plutella xylostella]
MAPVSWHVGRVMLCGGILAAAPSLFAQAYFSWHVGRVMLCGGILAAAPVSLRGLSPALPPAHAPAAFAAALVMQALHDRIDDDSSFLVAVCESKVDTKLEES